MRTRELNVDEWTSFFDRFSRRFHGRPVTVLVRGSDARTRALARHLPLLGVTTEQHDGEVESIEILTGDPGDPPAKHVAHMVRAQCGVRVGQVSNGEDEVLVIQSRTDPTTFIDFSKGAAVESDLDPVRTSGNAAV